MPRQSIAEELELIPLYVAHRAEIGSRANGAGRTGADRYTQITLVRIVQVQQISGVFLFYTSVRHSTPFPDPPKLDTQYLQNLQFQRRAASRLMAKIRSHLPSFQTRSQPRILDG